MSSGSPATRTALCRDFRNFSEAPTGDDRFAPRDRSYQSNERAVEAANRDLKRMISPTR
jgi:hypothetical protein